jgi:sugar phosphate permease
MKYKFSYLLGGFIGLLIGYALFYLMWVIFKIISPGQAFIAQTLVIENIFVIVLLILLAYPVEKILKSHKDRHQRYLNKLAEIEWVEQYGDDSRIR